MDASLVEEYNDKRSEPNIASHSSRSLNDLRSFEQGATVDKQESGKCHHFSIRGYVAEIRKSNRKICWPFHIIDNHYNLEEHANLLPPITVNEFRWWECQNCLRKAKAIENGAVKNCHNDEIKRLKTSRTSFHGNSIVGPHADAPNLLSGFQVVSGECMLDGRPVEVDSSMYLNAGHCHPEVCCSEIDKEFLLAGTTKEGTPKYEGGFGRPEEDQNLITGAPTCGAIKDETLRKGERDTTEIRKDMFGSTSHKFVCRRSVCGNVNTSETMLQGKNAHDTIIVEPKNIRLICEVADTEMDTGILTAMADSVSEFSHKDNQGPSKRDIVEMKEPHHKKVGDYGMLQGLDNSIEKDDAVTAVTVHECEFGSMGLDESNLETSKCNGDLIENKDDSQHCASRLGTSNGDLHRRKARKVRMLNDIIKSEVLGMSGKVHLSYGGEEVIPTINNSNVEPCASREKKMHTNSNLLVTAQEEERKLFRNKKRNETPEGEAEGPSLMHWLKRMPKKIKTHKGHAEPKHIDNAVVNSKSVADASTGKVLHSRPKGCGSIQGIDRKIIGSKKQNKTAQVEAVHSCFMPQQEGMPGNKHANIEDATAEQVNARKVDPKSARDKCSLYPDRELHDSPRKNVIMSKKENKTYKVKDGGGSSPMNGLKDFFGTFKYENVNGYQGSEKVSKKRSARRTDTTGEQAAVDGVPIAILELLQNNYLKKHQLNSERFTANMAHLSEMNNNMKGGKMLDLTESNGNEASSSQYKTQSMLNSQSNNTGCCVCATGKSAGNSHQQLKAQSSRGSGKRKRWINMNQGEGCCTSRGSPDVRLCIEQPRNRIQLPPTDSIRNYSPRDHSWQRNMLQKVESCHEARTISRQNPCRYAPHGAIGISNSLKIHTDIYHSSVLSHAKLQETNPNKVVTQETGGPKSIDPTVTHLHKMKKKVGAKTNKRMLSSAGKACLEAGKECHSKMMRPLDLYTDDTISAMHLLRLMDPAVCSTAPLCALRDKNQTEFLEKSKHGHNHHHKQFLGLEAGVRTNTASKYSGTLELLDQIHNQGNSSKIISPVPKIDTFGTSLQKGTPTVSNNCRTSYTFKGGHPSEVASSSKKCGKEKTTSSHSELSQSSNHVISSATQTRVSEENPVSRYGNSQDWLLSVVYSATHSEPSQPSKHVVQLGFKNKDEVDFPLKSSCQTELCVVNRNPADFSMPDEDNVYMIGYKSLKPKDVSPLGNGQFTLFPDAQRQRIMKLSTLKGLLRS